jgi:4-amino-4-deoxy-L-arabinose transferase-like glycosyltransferase
MNNNPFQANSPNRWQQWSKHALDGWWSLGLLIAAIALFTVNLGGVPLRDWDEGLVAQVAREIWRSPFDSLTWIFPTLWGEPYLNKPPLVHDLIAVAYAIGGVSEWTARLPGALLTACSVPLLYSIGRELFHQRLQAGFTALIYLTSLPVVRNGRLAMLDGAVLCFTMLMMLCLLRSRRDYRYTVGVGIGFGLICLSKGVMVGLLLAAIALLFLAWDTPRLLALPYLWLGLLLGSAPVVLWYGAQWFHYGQTFLSQNLGEQSFQRIWTDFEHNGGAPWYYVLEIIKYGVPWLLFLPLGCKLAWTNRNLSWAKLAIVWAGVYLLSISLMATKLPWYILPLYPALALFAGVQLTTLWQRGKHIGTPEFLSPPYSRVWLRLFAFLSMVSWVGAVYFGLTGLDANFSLLLVFAALGLTMATVAVLMAKQDAQFSAVLIWGTYVSLALLMASSHWVWELAEAYPVKPIASLVQQHTPIAQPVYTSNPDRRPSLDFYSDRPIIPADSRQLRRLWRRNSQPYLLLDDAAFKTLKLDSKQVLGTAEGWTLITKTKQ